MHPRNFGCDKIIRAAVRLYARTSFFHASGVQGIYNMCLTCYGRHVMVNRQLWKNGICLPVSHDCVADSGVQHTEVRCLFYVLC